MTVTEEQKYPVGKFQKPEQIGAAELKEYFSVIEEFPAKLKKEAEHLTDEQLDTPYRPEGWTIRQVVNHVADSHMNALIRFKLALTEETPIIKPYLEARWAELADDIMPIAPALMITEGVHARWVVLLRSIKEKDWKKEFIHPEKGRTLSLEESAGSYAWHCRHHLAHITTLKASKGWK